MAEQRGRILLNQLLIANGLVLEGDLPEAARFGAWLEQTEEIARSNGSGIWQSALIAEPAVSRRDGSSLRTR